MDTNWLNVMFIKKGKCYWYLVLKFRGSQGEIAANNIRKTSTRKAAVKLDEILFAVPPFPHFLRHK